ncbi:MAG: hypothetical protein ACK5RT_07125 [Dolichospermum sp.]
MRGDRFLGMWEGDRFLVWEGVAKRTEGIAFWMWEGDRFDNEGFGGAIAVLFPP